jgi:hypothetical protein
MAKRDPVTEYLSTIGRRGGQARVKKGAGVLSPEERSAGAKRAAEARWDKTREKAKPKAKAARKKAPR